MFKGKKNHIISVVVIIFVSFAMRAPMGCVGPLVGSIQKELGISSFFAGYLTTIPMLAFAVTAPFAGRIAVAVENKLLLLSCLAVNILGMLLRSFCGVWGLLMGTALMGLAVGTLNVLMPALIRKEYAGTLGLMMGVYTTAMTVSSALMAGTCQDISAAFGSWRISLASPVVFAAVAIFVCLAARNTFSGKLAAAGKGVSLGKCIKKQHIVIALFMGLQSLLFFSIMAWYPSIVTAFGGGAETSGKLLLLLQLSSLVPSFVMPILGQRCRRKGLLACLGALAFTGGFLAVLFSAGQTFAVLTGTVLLGLACGSTMSLALTIVAAQGSNSAETAQISAFTQCIGYILASFGPTGLAFVYDQTSRWSVVLLCMIGLSLLMAVLGLLLGRTEKSD